jgi:hypothetical protein
MVNAQWIYSGARCPSTGCCGRVEINPISVRCAVVDAPIEADGNFIVGAWVCSGHTRHHGWIAADEIKGWEPSPDHEGATSPLSTTESQVDFQWDWGKDAAG